MFQSIQSWSLEDGRAMLSFDTYEGKWNNSATMSPLAWSRTSTFTISQLSNHHRTVSTLGPQMIPTILRPKLIVAEDLALLAWRHHVLSSGPKTTTTTEISILQNQTKFRNKIKGRWCWFEILYFGAGGLKLEILFSYTTSNNYCLLFYLFYIKNIFADLTFATFIRRAKIWKDFVSKYLRYLRGGVP